MQIKALEGKPYDKRLKELDIFSPEKRRLSGNILTIFKYFKGC